MPYNQQPYQYQNPYDPYSDVGGSDPTGGFKQEFGSMWSNFTNQFKGLGIKRYGQGELGRAPSPQALQSYFIGSQPEAYQTAGILEDIAGVPAFKDFTPGASDFKSLGDRLTGKRIWGETGAGAAKGIGMGGGGEYKTLTSAVGAVKGLTGDKQAILQGKINTAMGAATDWGGQTAAWQSGIGAEASTAVGEFAAPLAQTAAEKFGAGAVQSLSKSMAPSLLSKLGGGLAAGSSMLSTAMPYLQAGMMIAQGVAGHYGAKRQLGLIGSQEKQLAAAGESLEALYGQRGDIYEQQFGEQLGQASYGAGRSLFDISQMGESVGFTGLSYSGTVSKRLSRAREGVRKQFGFSKTGLENILGEKMMGLEEWKAGQEAGITSELARLKYQRREAEAGSDWNPFT